MEARRKDAARNRTRILDAARSLAAQGETLTFNAIARSADTGVGTVYRHFESVEVLEEVLVWDRFDELAGLLDEATPERIEDVLEAHFGLLVSDPLFERVTSRPEPAHVDTTRLRESLIRSLSDLMQQAKTAGRLREDIDAADLLALLCGLAHAVRTIGVTAGSPRARALFGMLIDGLRAGRGSPQREGG